MDWREILTELIRRATSSLPADVEAALRAGAAVEAADSRARTTLEAILENVRLAREQSAPICQDTGALSFLWRVPRGADTFALEAATAAAVAAATENGWLRRNTIETLTRCSIDTNVAPGAPFSFFEQVDPETSAWLGEVWLLQKGGGCENVSAQYSLPDETLKAERDLEGARRCALHAVWRAQGLGCAPGILGVCVGGDRAEGFLAAKRQLLRPLDDHAAEPELAALEARALREANQLEIGPMGLGGRTTLLGVKATARPRLPASFFVTVAYMCWACRRCGARATAGGGVAWLG